MNLAAFFILNLVNSHIFWRMWGSRLLNGDEQAAYMLGFHVLAGVVAVSAYLLRNSKAVVVMLRTRDLNEAWNAGRLAKVYCYALAYGLSSIYLFIAPAVFLLCGGVDLYAVSC